MKNHLLLLLLSILWISCEKEKTTEPAIEEPFLAVSGGIYFANEGVFQNANASISYYNPASASVTNNIYYSVNSQSLGDVAQSISLINGKLYIIVNNSGKIEVCNPVTLERISTITGFTSPRYIQALDSTRALVTDLYSNTLSVIHTLSNTVIGSVALNGSTEQMIKSGSNVYVTNSMSDYLYVIDALTITVTDSILISKGANSIREDLNGKLWIACGGDYQSVNGAIYRVNPAHKQIEFSQTFGATDYLGRLCMNSNRDTIYFLKNDVYRMSVTAQTFPAAAFILQSGRTFYGLGVDKNRNEIYVSDAANFTQEGKIYRYDAQGIPVDDFTVGINPGEMFFLP